MTLLVFVHTLIALWLAVYGLHAFILLFLYLRHRRETEPTPVVDWDDLPHVTVQVPVYNEMHVVERVIDHVAALDYPRDKLHIQIFGRLDRRDNLAISRTSGAAPRARRRHRGSATVRPQWIQSGGLELGHVQDAERVHRHL